MRCSASSSAVTASSRHLGLVLRHLELRPVGGLGLRLHLDGGREAPVLALARRQLVVVLRLGDRVDAGTGGGVPEPAADVALDRLGVETLLPDALDQDRPRHLALAEARDARRRGEVVGCVLDGVVHVVRRHLDRELDLVVCELFDRLGIGKPLDQTGTVRRRGRRAAPFAGGGRTSSSVRSPSTRRRCANWSSSRCTPRTTT